MNIEDYVRVTKIESGSLQIPRPEKFSFPCPTCKNNIDVKGKIKFLLRDDLEAVENTLKRAEEMEKFYDDVKSSRLDLISYFRRLREMTAKYSQVPLIGWVVDAHNFLNERCSQCGLGLTIHYNFKFTPPLVPTPKVGEIAALELKDEYTQHYVRRQLDFKTWPEVENWLSGADTYSLIQKLKEISAILETLDYFRHPHTDLSLLELSVGSLKAFSNSIRDLINSFEQEVQSRPKIFLNLVEEYSHEAAPKSPMQSL
ncbi:MAG: hypothetical protein H3Z53_12360 [archaeon]|nr:hypothetical protein [archaeon]MCP8315142.1 hypothetical protein [archaeon]